MAEVPAVLADLPPRILAQFDSDWTASRHRRPKCSKADFAAGWRTAMERNCWKGRVRKPAAPESSSEAAEQPPATGYRVRWEIDLDEPDTPFAAAIEAQQIMRDPTSIATVFAVTAPDGTTELVDLLAHDSSAGPGGSDA